MSAGLPGLGLGGLFFILSALLAPILELTRTFRGRSSATAWRAVGRQFAQAIAMIVAVDLTLRALFALMELLGVGNPPSATSVTTLPLIPIGITGALLGGVLAIAELVALVSRARFGPRPIPEMTRRRARIRPLAGGVAVSGLFIALLAFGAADLSPLTERDGGPAPTVRSQGPALGDDSSAPELNPEGDIASGPSTARDDLRPAGATTSGNPAGGPNSESGPADTGAGTADSRDPSSVDIPSNPTTSGPGDVTTAGPPGSAGDPPDSSAPTTSGPPPTAAPPADTGPTESAGPPVSAGPPEGAGPPDEAGLPAGAGPPAGVGPPSGAGPPAGAGLRSPRSFTPEK